MNYQHHALATADFIESTQLSTPSGVSWARVPDGKSAHSLYHGSAGIIVFYLELFKSTGDSAFLDTAIEAGSALLVYVQDKVDSEAFITIGFYSGWPGYVFVLNELAKASSETRFRKGAIAALDRITAQSSKLGSGIGWVEPIPFSDITGITGEREVIDLSVGAAGVGIIYLYAYREGLLDSLDLACLTADRLLEVAQDTEDGYRWLMMIDMPFPFTAPNFAHGGAGVGYFLVDLYSQCQKPEYLQAAISGASYVMSRVTPQSQGHLVCHNEEQQPATLFYLGVCHGPAGTGRLMLLLYQVTKDTVYLDWLKANFQGLLSTGAPETRSKGLWQNLGQCCGDAGIGDYAIGLYRALGEDLYLQFAQGVADYVIAQAVDGEASNGGTSWQGAEHRSRPDFLEQQTGYMQGAAGIGSFLLNLHAVESGEACKINMPETPFA